MCSCCYIYLDAWQTKHFLLPNSKGEQTSLVVPVFMNSLLSKTNKENNCMQMKNLHSEANNLTWDIQYKRSEWIQKSIISLSRKVGHEYWQNYWSTMKKMHWIATCISFFVFEFTWKNLVINLFKHCLSYWNTQTPINLDAN